MSMRFLCPCRLCCNRYRGRWIHELPLVILGLRTRPSKATGQTPFFLVYGSEAILPTDVMWKSPRLEMYDEIEADGSRQLELDTVEEVICNALPSKKRVHVALPLDHKLWLGLCWAFQTFCFIKNRLFLQTIKLADKNEGQQELNRRPRNTPRAGFTTGLLMQLFYCRNVSVFYIYSLADVQPGSTRMVAR